MQTLSLAMIVKNEERTLERVLTAAKTFCDELIVVDTGSTDATVEIAERLGAKVSHFTWVDDFAAARNAAFAQCTQDWIIWLDADDAVSPESQAAIRGYKDTLLTGTHFDAVFLTYDYGRTKLIRERILRRSANFRWVAPVHEVIVVPADRYVVRNDAVIVHDTAPENMPRKVGRNIRILDRWYATGGDLRLLYLYGSELLDHQRFKESSDALELYLHRKGPQDPNGERYWATIKLTDALKAQRRYAEAITWCLRAVEQDGNRAEAFCMMGLCYVEQQQWTKAWPCLTAAASMEPPVVMCALLPEFYNEVPRRFLKVCYQQLGKPEKLRHRMAALGISIL